MKTAPAPGLSPLSLAFAAAAFAVLLVLALTGWLAHHAGERQALVDHTIEVRRAIAVLEARLARADAASLQWLLWPESREDAGPHASAELLDAEARDQLAMLDALTADNPAQQVRIGVLRRQVSDWLAGLDAVRAGAESGGVAPSVAASLLVHRQRVAAVAVATLRELDAEETRLLAVRATAWDRAGRQLSFALGAAALMAALILAMALRLWHRERRRRTDEREKERSQADALSLHNVALSEQVHAHSTSLSRSREALLAANDRLRRLSRELLRVQEVERASLARELHDDLGQQLGALRIAIDLLALDAAGEAERTRLREAAAIAAGCITQIRERAMALRPPLLDELGLAAALRWHAERQALLSGVAIEVDANLPGLAPADEWALHVYRIAQEAIANALRHGGARRVRLALAIDGDAVLLAIDDDGDGFDPELRGSGLGLRNMRERVELLDGSWRLASAPGRGTRIEARWPRNVVTAPPADAR